MPFPTVGKKYRLTPTLPPGMGPVVVDVVTGGFKVNILGWVFTVPYYGGEYDAFALGGLLIRCNGDGTFRGLSGDVEVEGTCVELPPP